MITIPGAGKSKQRKLDEAARERQALVDHRARVANQKRLKDQRAALAERKKAVATKSRALKLDKASKATKQRRKAS